jgi:tryptophan synthase beta chain
MNFDVDKNGYYGEFGGAFIPEMMYPNVKELSDNYMEILSDQKFHDEYRSLLKNYV